MKKILLCAILAYCSLCIWAAKSAGTPMAVLQPDGKLVTIQLLGDENFSWYQTIDGVILVREESAYYVAKITNGELKSTGVLAHDASDRNMEEENLVSSQDKDAFFAQADNSVRNRRNAAVRLDKKDFSPHIGEIHIPILMMNYSDKEFVLGDGDKAKLYEIFEEYFNGTTRTPYTSATRFQGYSSVRQYFIDASAGKFTPVFDLYGPYQTIFNHKYYGKASGRSSELLTEAIARADADIDFSKYDSNNDGNVDLVYVLYAGTGANLSGNRNDVWPACWYNKAIATKDGKTVNVIGAANELAIDDYDGEPIRAGIGVFCHEMSHGMGLPDLYWTLSYKPRDEYGDVDFDNCGPEDWDLMDGGENLYNGMWPCQYTAWEREYMGWLDPVEITEAQNITLNPLNKGGQAYKITNPANPFEYYTIEHSGYDEWNYYLNKTYGNGMLIMHLNSSADGFSMSPNNVYGHPNVSLVPADGKVISYYSYSELPTVTLDDYRNSLKGDIYPGLMDVTSVECFNNYVGQELVCTFPITNIVKNDDESVSFRFMGGVCDLVLADGETYNEETIQNNMFINYTRSFNNTSWQSLYIPFSMTYDDWKDDFEVAYINSVRQYDNDDDGVADETIMDIIKIKNGSLIPNTPYLIKAKSVGKKTIAVSNTTLYQAEENSIECSTMLAKYTFTGTYNTIPAATLAENNYYGMGGGSLIMTDGTSNLKPYRWYLNIESRSPMYNVGNDAKSITINVVAEEEAAGISQISSYGEHSSAIYDLNGRKMAQKTLKPGLYIKNGKKMLIK